MSVEKLKMVTISGDESLLDDVIVICKKEPVFQIDNADEILPDSGEGTVRKALNPYTPLLSNLTSLCNISKVTPELEEGSQKIDVESAEAMLKELQRQYNELNEECTSLDNLIFENQKIIEQLSHIINTEADLTALFNLEYFRVRFGHMPRESYESLNRYTADIDNFFFFVSSIEKRDVWCLYLTPKARVKRIDALFASLNFERVFISDKVNGTPREAIEVLTAETVSIKEKRDEKKMALDEFKKGMSKKLGLIKDCLDNANEDFNWHIKPLYSPQGFIMGGWIPKKAVERFEKSLLKIKGISVTFSDPITQKDKLPPPTKLKNIWLFKPFEEFVNMYGTPTYNEVDPTPLVALSYMIFFGMMFGDIGQGLLITVIGALLWFWKKVKLGRILARVGVFAMIFGLIYGSVFGLEDIIHGFNPMENINTVLFVAVGLGCVMISIAMLFNVANGIKQKNIEKAVLSSNGLSGLTLFWSLLLILVDMFGLLPLHLPKLPLIIIAGVSLLLIFFRLPLAGLIEGENKLGDESIFSYMVESLFELFEVFLSLFSNTLSYIRVGVFALSHVGMMTVVLLLAKGSNGNLNPVVMIIGNIFVTGFEGMIVCIQALRLEFYEIFGRFYEGNGREYKKIKD